LTRLDPGFGEPSDRVAQLRIRAETTVGEPGDQVGGLLEPFIYEK
jgi:hypothetical protein